MSAIPLGSHNIVQSQEHEWHLPSRGKVAMLSLIIGESAIFTIFVVAYIYYIGKSLSGPTPQILEVPVINSIARTNTTTTINYTTGLSGTYTLRGTNNLSFGAPGTNWPAISTLSSGDSAPHSTSFTDTEDNKFYIITAQ